MTTERKTYRKDVTDAEIETFMRPRIEEMMRDVVPRVVVREGKHGDTDGRGSQTAGKMPECGQTEDLTSVEREYAESILECPNLTVTRRAAHLALSPYMNNKIMKALISKGMIEQVTLSLGYESRGVVKFLELMEKGYKALGKKPPPERAFRCSAEHYWWQKNIAAYYRSKGFETEIEMSLNSKRCDVGFVKDGLKIAVEVGLTPKNEVLNVQRDLEVGFHRVLVACKNTNVKRVVEQRLGDVLTDEHRARVKVILLSEFSFVKEIVGKRVRKDAVQTI